MSESPAGKILLIDHDKARRQTLRAHLELAGWSVAESARGAIGVELAKRFAPHIILLDPLLPDLPGAEVLRELKLDVLTADIPVIVISSARPQELQLDTQAVAAQVSWPVAMEHLMATVGRVAGRRPRAP